MIRVCTLVEAAEDGTPTSQVIDVSFVEDGHPAGLDPDGRVFHVPGIAEVTP